MPAYVTRPEIVLPGHKVTTGEIIDDIRAHHPDHPRLRAALRVAANTGVHARYFTRPLAADTVSGTAPITVRVPRAFSDALDLAERAARRALNTHSLDPTDVDAIVTSHSTSWAVPNLDIHLIERLGLRPTTRRLPMTTLACAGGVYGIIRAAEHVTARPGARVLVVAAEVISSVYNHADTSIEAMIYKALFGDSAGAAIVTSEPLAPGLRVDDTWEFILPSSTQRYRGRLDETGLHFDSDKTALTAADDVLPHLHAWLAGWRPAFAVIHPGGPRIIDDVTDGLDLHRPDARHSWDSLAENGNLGGIAGLDVLARTHTTPPQPGTEGLMVSFGPGFATAAIRGTWHA